MILPGDGIGKVMAANLQVIDWLAKHKSLVDISEDEVAALQ